MSERGGYVWPLRAGRRRRARERRFARGEFDAATMAWHPHDDRRNVPMSHHGYRERSTLRHQEPRWLDVPDDTLIHNDRGIGWRRSPEEWYEGERVTQRQLERHLGSHSPEYSHRDHYHDHMPRGREWSNSKSPFGADAALSLAGGGGGGVRDRSFSPHERGGYDRQRSYSPTNKSYDQGPKRWSSGRSYEREQLPPRLSKGRRAIGERQFFPPPPPPHFQSRSGFVERNDAPASLKSPGLKHRETCPVPAQRKAYGAALSAADRAMDVTPKPHTVTMQSKGKAPEPPKTKLALHSPTAFPKMLDAPQPPTQSGQGSSSQCAEVAVSPAVTQAVVANSAPPKPSSWSEKMNVTDRVVNTHADFSVPTKYLPKDINLALSPALIQKFALKGEEDDGQLNFAETSVAGMPSAALCKQRQTTDAAGGAPEPVRQDGESLATCGGIPFLSAKQEDSASSAAGPSDVAFGLSAAAPPIGVRDAKSPGMSAKEPEGETHLDTVDEEVLQKRRDIEQAYREDCETFCMVVRMLVDKEPSLEKSVQASMRANIMEMGQQHLQQLREFVVSRKRLRSQENTSASPPVRPVP